MVIGAALTDVCCTQPQAAEKQLNQPNNKQSTAADWYIARGDLHSLIRRHVEQVDYRLLYFKNLVINTTALKNLR